MAVVVAQAGPSTSSHADGSRTITITEAAPRPGSPGSSSNIPNQTLRLRGGPRSVQRVAWDEDVVDNEGCGRKSSKICCIYHKPRKFDESSSEESSSDSDSDSSLDGNHQSQRRNRHRHRHAHNYDPQQQTAEQGSDKNAYEIVPSLKKGKRKEASN